MAEYSKQYNEATGIGFHDFDLMDEFNKCKLDYAHCTPNSKESYYYRKVFAKYFGKHDNLIPHFWMPRWSNVNDPSAREINNYKEG